ncbi:MAG: RyR domain-containing protein [Methanobrevibacter sp.]|nr:RyR domain-containing protein [Methanobrevibacter sp.]
MTINMNKSSTNHADGKKYVKSEGSKNKGLISYVSQFFEILEINDDKVNRHFYRKFMKEAVLDFLNDESQEKASDIYKLFFEIYQITSMRMSDQKKEDLGKTEPNYILNLLDTLRKYEESAESLIERDIDIYVHSVNVFILGLAIYANNETFREVFMSQTINNDKYQGTNYDKYQDAFETNHEEFFYRWGITSLFHDIAYPLEIINEEMKKFINDSVDSLHGKNEVEILINFKNFDNFNSIYKKNPDFGEYYRELYDEANFLDLFRPLDILAHKLYLTFGKNVGLCEIKDELDNYIKVMGQENFLNHGYFSAIIVLLIYGYLIQKYERKSSYFFFPVADSATAILLHKFYDKVFMKNYDVGRLNLVDSPLTFLLILCNILENWDKNYDDVKTSIRKKDNEFTIDLSEKRIDIEYIIKNGALSTEEIRKKEKYIYKVLDIQSMFSQGLSIDFKTDNKTILELERLKKVDVNTPRQLLENIEKIAKKTHEYHNDVRKKKGVKIVFKNFEDLPEAHIFSNWRVARSIPNKLNLIGYEIASINDSRKAQEKFHDNDVEYLAEIEHADWMEMKLNQGYKYGPVRNEDKKISPYLVPWDKVDEGTKDYDRDIIINIPEILKLIDLKVVKTKYRLLTPMVHDYFVEILSKRRLYIGEKDFDKLRPNVRNSSYNQANYLPDIYESLDYNIVNEDDEGLSICNFPLEELEKLGKKYHEIWLESRLKIGWKYGIIRDEDEKTNPNIKPWKELNKTMKKVNILTMEEMPELLKKVGLKIVSNKKY